MKERHLYIHIGAPKTATTFLQKVIFENVDSISCLIKPILKVFGKKVRLKHMFHHPPDIWSDPEVGVFSQIFEKREKNRDEGDILLSDEGIYGWPISPSPRFGSANYYTEQTGGHSYFSHLSSHLDVLSSVARKKGFDGIKILVSIRRQYTWLPSMYAQFSHGIRGASQRNFEHWARFLISNPEGYYSGGGSKLDYSLMYREITNKIKSENILVIPFEKLLNNKEGYLAEIFNFIGVKNSEVMSDASRKNEVNKSSTSEFSWSIKPPIRHGPNLRPSRLFAVLNLPTGIPYRWPDFFRSNTIFMTEELKDEIISVYGDKNALLDESLPGIDLGDKGYY